MVDAADIHTYRAGPTFVTTREVTRADYISICDAFAAALTAKHGTPHRVQPAAVGSGGWEVFNDGEARKAYKAMRHWANSGACACAWPWIGDGVMEAWRVDVTRLWPAGTRITTCLKAFYATPAWTLDELTALAVAMQGVGIEMRVAKTRGLKAAVRAAVAGAA